MPLDFIDIITTGSKQTNIIERNYFTYNKPTSENKVKSLLGTAYTIGTIITGKHDYRNVTIYKNWNDYYNATGGNGRMLKYRE
jgi:hypothetical protein